MWFKYFIHGFIHEFTNHGVFDGDGTQTLFIVVFYYI